jgi:hypothetical protein
MVFSCDTAVESKIQIFCSCMGSNTVHCEAPIFALSQSRTSCRKCFFDHKEKSCHKQRSVLIKDVLVSSLHLKESRRISWNEAGRSALMLLCDKWHKEVLQ